MTKDPSLPVVSGPTFFLMSAASSQTFTLGIGLPWMSVTTPFTRVIASAYAGVGATAGVRARAVTTARIVPRVRVLMCPLRSGRRDRRLGAGLLILLYPADRAD